MKLVRFGAIGAEKPGILDAEGQIRDLSAHIDDINGAALSAASLDKLRAIDIASLPVVSQDVRLGSIGIIMKQENLVMKTLGHLVTMRMTWMKSRKR